MTLPNYVVWWRPVNGACRDSFERAFMLWQLEAAFRQLDEGGPRLGFADELPWRDLEMASFPESAQ